MADFAVWGERFGGFHLTNLLIYLAAIALWFAALDRARRRAARSPGSRVLVWAVHPSHAESVAWLAERKGVLGMLFAGACALGYARFRSRAAARAWLVLAMRRGVFAVWSKATARVRDRGARRRSSSRCPRAACPGGAASPGSPRSRSRRRSRSCRSSCSRCAGRSSARRRGACRLAAGDRCSASTASTSGSPRWRCANAVSYPIATAGPSALDLVARRARLCRARSPRCVRGSRAPLAARRGACGSFGWLPVSHLDLAAPDGVRRRSLLARAVARLRARGRGGLRAIPQPAFARVRARRASCSRRRCARSIAQASWAATRAVGSARSTRTRTTATRGDVRRGARRGRPRPPARGRSPRHSRASRAPRLVLHAGAARARARPSRRRR